MNAPVTIDLKPSWSSLMPLLIELLASQNHSARGNARAELMRLAAAVDRMNANANANTGA